MREGALPVGGQFGKYQIVRLLGEGGMGAVYEAIHTGLAKRVAIKTLLPSMAAVPEARARFLREGEAASRINHPHVVEIFDVGEENGVAFLVMEFLTGESLAERLARGPLELSEAVDIVVPVASAVAAGHEAGVIHRDLKPANIYLAVDRLGECTPKVLDFGVSKLMKADQRSNLTATMSMLGTASYMSPEQARGAKRVGPASDQYALGAILHETLTGRRLHDGENFLEIVNNIVVGSVPRPQSLRADIPEAVDEAIMHALEREPQDRFPSLTDLAVALLPFASPGVRATWQKRLRAPAREGAPAGDAGDRAPAGRPGGRPARPRQVRGTRVLEDEAGPHMDSTFRSSAAEIQTDPSNGDAPAAPGTAFRRRNLLVGLGLLTAAGAAFALTRGPSTTPPADSGKALSAGPSADAALAGIANAEGGSPGRQAPRRSYLVRVDPPSAAVSLDGRPAGVGVFEGTLEDGGTHLLTIEAADYLPVSLTFSSERPPPPLVTLQRAPARPPATVAGASPARPPHPKRAGSAPPHATPAANVAAPPRSTPAATVPAPTLSPAAAPPAPAPPKTGTNGSLILR